MDNQIEDLKQNLNKFSKIVEAEILQISNGQRNYKKTDETQEYQQLKASLKPILNEIAQTGESNNYDWKQLKNYVIIITRDVLQIMQSSFPDVKSNSGESFEDELDVILQFLCGFENKPPFTIQRICELLIEPKRHYKSCKKILFALEKLVNVSPI